MTLPCSARTTSSRSSARALPRATCPSSGPLVGKKVSVVTEQVHRRDARYMDMHRLIGLASSLLLNKSRTKTLDLHPGTGLLLDVLYKHALLTSL